ncbi:hypothetical protein SAMN02799624_05363 [Paenibacillus sp. UNC496MF]|uniref:hypothetical protein n=1 Tax=Paenibacillus sp. UNC496MF TaxID=1502753 RepID=UPI0008E144FF|nr:hypothetical protein [Paenibacillus sp. UNC496MF]SFJ64813.1 hypothetical protein SAMN02799624_05363 [Paenibacillus sp. UNC496MF]
MFRNKVFLLATMVVLLVIGFVNMEITKHDRSRHQNESLIRRLDSVGSGFTDQVIAERRRRDRLQHPLEYQAPNENL